MSKTDASGRIMLWAGIGCVLLAVCLLGGSVLGFGGLLWLVRDPEDVTVEIDSPIQAEVGDPVQILIRITNNAPAATELSSIDIGAGYLDGFVIQSSTPKFSRVDEFAGTFGGEDYFSHYFDHPIASGEMLTVTIFGKAVAAGDFQGLFDVCIGSDMRCLENTLRTVVE